MNVENREMLKMLLKQSRLQNLMRYCFCILQLSIGVSVLCIPVLRYVAPNNARPIKVFIGFPIIYILATIAITVVPMFADPVSTGKNIPK